MKVTLDKLPGVIERHHQRNMDRIDVGLGRAAQRGKAHMVKNTPADQGQLRNSWRVSGSVLSNDAPHGGIVEMGARPHAVNRTGIDALTGWARRRLGIGNEKEARAVAFAIAAKIRRVGQRPTWFFRSQMKALTKIAKQEVERVLRQSPRT